MVKDKDEQIKKLLGPKPKGEYGAYLIPQSAKVHKLRCRSCGQVFEARVLLSTAICEPCRKEKESVLD